MEYKIAPHLLERIDLVDTQEGVAYEPKTSPNNPHHEFYRDVFKVVIARDNGLLSLTNFVFIAPVPAADKLLRSMGSAVITAGTSLGLSIEIVGI